MKKITVVLLIIIIVITTISCKITKPDGTVNGTEKSLFYNKGEIGGDYIFKGYKSFHLNILCKRTGENDYSVIKENTGPITVFRDKLIGFLPPDNLNIATDAHTWRDNEFTGIWISDPDGGNTKVLINDEERKFHIQSMSGERSNELTCGDYIGIILNPEIEVDPNEENLPDCELLIINIYTGEYVVSRPQFD